MNKIKKSINFKLSLWIIISLVVSVLLAFLIVQITKPIHFLNVRHVNYDKDRYETEVKVLNFINELYDVETDKMIFIQDNITCFDGNSYFVDKTGQVKFKNENDGYSAVESINLDNFKNEIQKNNDEKFQAIYPLTIDNDIYYLIIIKNLHGISIYTNEINYTIAAIISFIIFILLIYWGFSKKVRYIKYINSSINEIATGNLNYKLTVKGEDELASVAMQINLMEDNLLRMIEKERKNDKIQRELITNISHDLKTPLTIILGYLDIIRTKSYDSEDDVDKYINITYDKAVSLQKLIMKLFDFVKLSDKEVVLNKSDVNIDKLLRQVIMDYSTLAEEQKVTIKYKSPKDIIIQSVDLDKICRVFNNLMNNSIKYAEKDKIVQVTLKKEDFGSLITFKNKCTKITEDDLDMLFNRFYRGDKARNSSIDGSGIGLSIVKRIVELHNSNIWSELHDDEIWFIIRLRG